MTDSAQGGVGVTVRSQGLLDVGANFDIPLPELMERVRAEVSARRAQAALLAGAEASTASSNGLPRWSSPEPWPELRHAYTMPELLKYSDEDFVEVVFRTLLRRPPDASGMAHYMDALRSGAQTKIEVLGNIRFSEEGRARNIHVDGLLIPYTLHRWRHKRFVGRFVRAVLMLGRLRNVAARLDTLEGGTSRHVHYLGNLFNRFNSAAEDRFDVLHDELRAVRSELLEQAAADQSRADAEYKQVVAELHAGLRSLGEENRELRQMNSQLSLVLRDRLEEVDKKFVSARRSVLELQRQFMSLGQSLVSGDGPAGSPATPAASAIDIPHDQYVAFEDAFRGNRDDIKQRVAEYIQELDLAGIERGRDLVIDIGCGRGEWLEVLREHGFRGRGVDLNEAMAASVRELGFDAVAADALEYLNALPAGSVGAITSMHVVEHLPHAVLVRLIDEAFRALRPGGVLILETPNPENITVGSCWFYLDPTHGNPIPSPLLRWLATERGFDEAKVVRLTKNRGTDSLSPVAADQPGAAQINAMLEWFNAAPDYAVVAVKHGAPNGDPADA
ncbi:methyltransferase domain-containing protein [Pinirhizobacter soli]|uniref:methyltransferase domain-containing protein n=1 Tax=Pinirhizobacter soli TaxID=2786953 RepID=UPI00202AB055|nr:methyltransferase domain-containing protein [Pinirhizobacter soli]